MIATTSLPPDDRFITETGLAAIIAGLALPVLAELGCRLVRVRITATNGQTVQLMADRDGAPFRVEDCATISRQLASILDESDPIPGQYLLEVSSPGIDRPLVRPSDFEDWSGFEAKVELSQPIDGRKRFRGEIEGYEAETRELRLAVTDLPGQDGPVTLGLPVSLIAEARLVLTDDLIRASLVAAKRAGGTVEGAEIEQGAGDDDIELEEEHADGADHDNGRFRQ